MPTRQYRTQPGDTPVQVNIRMPETLKEALETAAAQNKRSLTAEILYRLEHSLKPTFK